VLAAVVCVLGIDYWVIPPVRAVAPTDTADLVPMAAFLTVALFVSRVTDALRSARDAARRSAASLDAANRQLAAQAAELRIGTHELQERRPSWRRRRPSWRRSRPSWSRPRNSCRSSRPSSSCGPRR
jgi:hypothetical protein